MKKSATTLCTSVARTHKGDVIVCKLSRHAICISAGGGKRENAICQQRGLTDLCFPEAAPIRCTLAREREGKIMHPRARPASARSREVLSERDCVTGDTRDLKRHHLPNNG
jgi:hypothetical protein